MIGKLKRVPLRKVWEHEAKDFTSWMQDNIDILNDILDLSLTSAEKEQSAGSFSVDLVAEDESGTVIVIENQLEKSDHDHLGKLITYLTSLEAKAAIWIVADARPEHVGAITWLNESSSADFYLIKVEAVKIANSSPAPLFTLIVGPSEEGRAVGATKKNLAERFKIRLKFWTNLITFSKTKTKLHSKITPGSYSWLGQSAGKRGLNYNYGVRQHESSVELYIDRGDETELENNKIFDTLYAKRAEIQKSFGSILVWKRLDNRRACRIIHEVKDGGWKDEEKWPKLHEKMVDKMVKFDIAFRDHVKKLKI